MNVTLPPDQAAHPPAWLAGADPRVRVVAGGATRGDSVAAAVILEEYLKGTRRRADALSSR